NKNQKGIIMKSLDFLNYRRERNSIIIYLLAFISFSIIMIGCAPAPTFIKSDYEQQEIKSIAIMPVMDRRNIVEDKVQSQEDLSKIEELLSNNLMDKKYDVLSPSSVKNTIQEKAIENMSPKNLCSKLNVDGVLFSELFDYTDVFFINHSIKMGFKFFDANGDSLWINYMDDSDRPYLSAIGSSVGWAVALSVDDKIASKDKIPTILGGVAAAEVVYALVDVIFNETSQSIDRVFKSLPEREGSKK
ncbi:MAG: hypothetical protein KDC67_15290, partial [Ignavibacteriae bacterium]|nr:hypothetical protein [Ignavibacteriota bacterium]